MIIYVSGKLKVELLDRHDFSRFKVVVASTCDPEHVRAALDGLATVAEDGHALVSEAALRQRPEIVDDVEWQRQLTLMIQRARKHGWIDDQGTRIKSHIVWQEAAG